MSRVSDSLYNGDIAKPKTTSATNDEISAAVRAIIDALRETGVTKDGSSVTDQA